MNYAAGDRGAAQGEKMRDDAGSTSSVDDNDDTFEALLKEFQQIFEAKQDSMELVTAKVVQICNTTLGAAGIRHTVISSRIKTWKSAEGSIRRKKDERATRQRLRTAVESRNHDWDTYCSHSNLGSTETKPFKSDKEMLIHLRDFGGVRISLYFPGDVEKISDIFKKKFRVDSETRKQQSKDVAMDLQRRIEKLGSSTSAEKSSASITERSFSGYKATHFCVRLLDEDIPSNKISIWKDLVVEIQVGTLVMHAWSEIEHDMIYKPLETQTISEDEVRLLDLINGIVATGESALRQLEASMDKRRKQREEDKAAFAMSHHELGTWMDKHWLGVENVVMEGDWEYLVQLYAILKATGDHRLETIQQLLQRTESKGFVHRSMFSIKILKLICEPSADFEEPQWPKKPNERTIAEARYWARQFIYSLNMARFLGVAEAFLSEGSSERPQLANLLDVIHPTSPTYADDNTLVAIATYCKSLINRLEQQLHGKQDICNLDRGRQYSSEKLQELAHEQLVPIAACLSRVDRVVISSELGGGVFIPLSIVGLFVATKYRTDGERLKIERGERLKIERGERLKIERRERIALQVQQELSFMEHYADNRKSENYDQLAMWDHLNLAISGNADGNMEESYLVPNLAYQGNYEEAKWKLVARTLHLDVSRTSDENVSPETSFMKSPDWDNQEDPQLAHIYRPEDGIYRRSKRGRRSGGHSKASMLFEPSLREKMMMKEKMIMTVTERKEIKEVAYRLHPQHRHFVDTALTMILRTQPIMAELDEDTRRVNDVGKLRSA